MLGARSCKPRWQASSNKREFLCESLAEEYGEEGRVEAARFRSLRAASDSSRRTSACRRKGRVCVRGSEQGNKEGELPHRSERLRALAQGLEALPGNRSEQRGVVSGGHGGAHWRWVQCRHRPGRGAPLIRTERARRTEPFRLAAQADEGATSQETVRVEAVTASAKGTTTPMKTSKALLTLKASEKVPEHDELVVDGLLRLLALLRVRLLTFWRRRA